MSAPLPRRVSAQSPKEDSHLHKGLRRNLLQALRTRGIREERVLKAMDAVPRHYFLEPAFERRAYEDSAFPIRAGQTISQPYTVAFQTELLELKKWDKVLEVGTGSGYQTCVLAQMGAIVFTIERQRELYEELGHFELLRRYPTVKRFLGDGYRGLPTYGPFDKCLVTAGAPFVPPALLEQLKPGGILVIPVGEEGVQKMLRIRKGKDGQLAEEVLGNFSFVPMLTGTTNL
jgi:protein-L-isoaspartate(D-aspartate) O-methyltransferase